MSRDAFLPLLAAGTLGLRWMEHRERMQPGFLWRQRIADKTSLHPEWLSSFERSYAASTAVLRVGGILDASQLQERPRLQVLVSLFKSLNVSICLCWGECTSNSVSLIRQILSRDDPPSKSQPDKRIAFAYLSPTPEQMQYLREPPTLSSLPINQSCSPDVHVEDNPIPLEANSGQLIGESWQSFFARRDSRRRSRVETAREHQARLSREQAAATKSCPGKRGPTVWYWRNEGRWRVRTQIDRSEVEDYWRYGKDQKRFDGWANCWDICTEFGDPDPESDWEEEPAEEVPDNSSMVMEEGEVTEEQDPTTILGKLLGQDAVREEDYSVEDMSLLLADIAFERYGFDGNLLDLGSPEQRSDWELTCRVLGNGRWLRNPLNKGFCEAWPQQQVREEIQHYLYMLAQTEARQYNTLPSLDLADLSSVFWSAEQWEFSVKIVNIDSDEWYLLSAKKDPGDLHILVHDPVSVLQAFRCNWGPTIRVIAGQLYNHGIQFHTVLRGRRPTTREKQTRHHHTGLKCILGYRRAGYEPDSHDWHAYEAERNRFLRSHRGRAAAMCGGLIGRLSREYVGEEAVVNGPDPDLVYVQGRCFLDTAEGGYWDDELSPEETDLICGLYVVETAGTSGSLSEASHMSWWPRPGQFQLGGMYLGFWSRDCEKWFQNRIRECRSKPKLMSATKWRTAMNMQLATRRIPERNKDIARAFLKDMFGIH
ncbi:hypothetical protein V5O48_007977 [Marasmius crinis-equi]|uniref:Uncharacterized protein n=1 Tax=Marasmius crinis-equi TaxID=585013 RepID=A0ABR3FF62_9AGAR